MSPEIHGQQPAIDEDIGHCVSERSIFLVKDRAGSRALISVLLGFAPSPDEPCAIRPSTMRSRIPFKAFVKHIECQAGKMRKGDMVVVLDLLCRDAPARLQQP